MDLSPAEEQIILKHREQRRVEDAGGYGPALKTSRMEEDLRGKLLQLNADSLAFPYGPLPSGLDATTIAAVERIQQVGFSMNCALRSRNPEAAPQHLSSDSLALRCAPWSWIGPDGPS